MTTRREFGSATVELVQGDITRERVEAIASAANERLAGGGGVDGAIHRAGGPEIMAECRKIGGCPTGSAVATSAGRLAARFLLQAVGPVYRDGRHGEPERLASAYRSCLELANALGAVSIAFPSISTGFYGYPLAEAAPIALGTVADYLLGGRSRIERVRFVLFDAQTFAA
jgi:O-acetyl-ADP-ribose deacetylase (regulator of RNase III)